MIIQIDRNNRKGVFMKADLIVRIRNNIQFGEPCTFDEALFWKCFGAIKGRVRTVSEHWKEDGYVDIKVDLNPQIHFTIIEDLLANTEKIKKSGVELHLYVVKHYELKDYDDAVAAELCFRKGCEYYEDFIHEEYNGIYDEIYEEGELLRSLIIPTEKLFIRPTKVLTQKYAGVVSDDIASFITPALKEHLVQYGIGEKFFRPAYTKRDKETPYAYKIYGGDNILPKGALIGPGYIRKELDTGLILKDVLPGGELDEYFGRQVILNSFGYPFEEELISPKAYEMMQEANETFEYYGDRKRCVVSKKLFQLIAEKCPDIIDGSSPIYLMEE